jgi:uncharacterized protein
MEIPLVVGISPTLGFRGLLAARDIAAGEVIECCPVILFPVEQEDLIEASALHNYYYLWDETHYAIALGYGSLYNHAYHANVRYERDFEAQTIVHIAAKAIRQGEELTMNYNGSPDDETPLDPEKWW